MTTTADNSDRQTQQCSRSTIDRYYCWSAKI